MTTPDAGPAASALDGIRARSERARTAPALTKDWACARSAADVPALLAFADAALKLADDWKQEFARLEPSGADAVSNAGLGSYLVSGRLGALEDCAVALREAIGAALAGKEAD